MVILVLLVIGCFFGFFFSVYVMFGLFIQVLEHQSKEEKKISLRWKQLIVGYKCVSGTVH